VIDKLGVGASGGLWIIPATSVSCASLPLARTVGCALFRRYCQYFSEWMLKLCAAQYAFRLRPLPRQAL